MGCDHPSCPATTFQPIIFLIFDRAQNHPSRGLRWRGRCRLRPQAPVLPWALFVAPGGPRAPFLPVCSFFFQVSDQRHRQFPQVTPHIVTLCHPVPCAPFLASPPWWQRWHWGTTEGFLKSQASKNRARQPQTSTNPLSRGVGGSGDGDVPSFQPFCGGRNPSRGSPRSPETRGGLGSWKEPPPAPQSPRFTPSSSHRGCGGGEGPTHPSPQTPWVPDREALGSISLWWPRDKEHRSLPGCSGGWLLTLCSLLRDLCCRTRPSQPAPDP